MGRTDHEAYTANVERFTGFAALYDAHRPEPPGTLGDLLPALAQVVRPRLVVDLGCGTGLSTRFWAERAEQVIGIDPTPDMRIEAERRTASAHVWYRAGWGHQTGLPAGSADLVTCSQSFHWMAPAPTLAEITRILRPGGVFAAYDHDWPPTTGCWEADAAYADMLARVHGREQEKGIAAALQRWSKDGHLRQMQASGCFRFTKEVVLHHCDTGSAERLVGLALSQGNVETLLRRGVSEADIGMDTLRAVAGRTLGDVPRRWYWSYRVRIGVA